MRLVSIALAKSKDTYVTTESIKGLTGSVHTVKTDPFFKRPRTFASFFCTSTITTTIEQRRGGDLSTMMMSFSATSKSILVRLASTARRTPAFVPRAIAVPRLHSTTTTSEAANVFVTQQQQQQQKASSRGDELKTSGALKKPEGKMLSICLEDVQENRITLYAILWYKCWRL